MIFHLSFPVNKINKTIILYYIVQNSITLKIFQRLDICRYTEHSSHFKIHQEYQTNPFVINDFFIRNIIFSDNAVFNF